MGNVIQLYRRYLRINTLEFKVRISSRNRECHWPVRWFVTGTAGRYRNAYVIVGICEESVYSFHPRWYHSSGSSHGAGSCSQNHMGKCGKPRSLKVVQYQKKSIRGVGFSQGMPPRVWAAISFTWHIRAPSLCGQKLPRSNHHSKAYMELLIPSNCCCACCYWNKDDRGRKQQVGGGGELVVIPLQTRLILRHAIMIW